MRSCARALVRSCARQTYLAAKRGQTPDVLDDIATEYGTPDHTLRRPIKVGVHPYAILIASHGVPVAGLRPG